MLDGAGEWWCLLCVCGWWSKAERTMWPLVLVGVDEHAEHVVEVAAVHDQQPVQTLRADGADEVLRDHVCLWARTGVLTVRMPSLREASSKELLLLAVASRTRRRMPLSLKPSPRLRACWVTHSPVGFLVQPGEPDAASRVGDEEEH